MQTSNRVLAGRYAAALFQAAAAKGEDQKISADLNTAYKTLLDQSALLHHPRATPDDKKKIVDAALKGKVGATTLRFLELLLEKKRWDLFGMVALVYGRLAAEKRGAVKASVRTASPLDAAAQAALSARLKKFVGKDIELDMKEDPELIGGVVVKIGDWVLDSSLRGQLRRMKESIYNHGN